MMNRLLTILRNYAELGRISNLPTIFTNVLVGGAIAHASGAALSWPKTLVATIAVSCFYLAGMALNDVVDASIDRIERPGRPIPSGRISRSAAVIFVLILLCIGTGMLAIISVPALIAGSFLVAVIVAYDLSHNATAASVLLMGACRGLAYVVGAAANVWPPDWMILGWLSGALAIYTIFFSIIARSENQTQLDRRRWLSVFIPLIAAVPLTVLRPTGWAGWTLLALAAMLAWLSRGIGFTFESPPRVRNAVMAWLAGICLVDVFYLALLDQPFLALIACGCFGVTVVGHRWILGT